MSKPNSICVASGFVEAIDKINTTEEHVESFVDASDTPVLSGSCISGEASGMNRNILENSARTLDSFESHLVQENRLLLAKFFAPNYWYLLNTVVKPREDTIHNSPAIKFGPRWAAYILASDFLLGMMEEMIEVRFSSPLSQLFFDHSNYYDDAVCDINEQISYSSNYQSRINAKALAIINTRDFLLKIEDLAFFDFKKATPKELVDTGDVILQLFDQVGILPGDNILDDEMDEWLDAVMQAGHELNSIR